MAHAAAFDLDAYLDRIGRPAVGGADLATLSALHLAHVTSIPFENLDVLWRRGIALDAASLQSKLVRGGRGGYCFEQNALFALALEALGFDVVPLAARVRYRATRLLPRTHQLLLVTIGGERHIADVGFGGNTLLAPLPLVAGETFAQHAWRYRLVREGDLHVLQIEATEGFVDLYAFTLERAARPDLEMANWYVSTHPASRFVTTLTVTEALAERPILPRPWLVAILATMGACLILTFSRGSFAGLVFAFLLLGILRYPRILWAGLILALLITVEEISQVFIANRTFSLLDLAFSYAGIFLGAWLAWKIAGISR